MKNKSIIAGGPRQNEQNDPVYCSECGKLLKGKSEEEGCVCPLTDTQKQETIRRPAGKDQIL